MKRVVLGFIIISGVYVSIPGGYASEVQKDLESFSKLKYTISSIYTSNLRHIENPEHFSNLNFSFSVSSKFKKKYPVTLGFFGTKSLNREQKFLLGNTSISFSDKFYYRINRTHSLILPTSENSQKNTYLIGTLLNNFSKSFELHAKDDIRISTSLNGGFVFNSHKYKTSLLGASSINYGFSQSISLNLIYKKFTFSSFFGAYQNYTYESNLSESYASAQTFMFPFKDFQVSLTHSIGGSLMAPNGEDLGVQLFDVESSNISLGLSKTF